MKFKVPTRALAQATGVLAVAAAVAAGMTGTAHAQTVDSGSLSFSGDAGDYISGGQSYAYSTAGGDSLTVSASTDDRVVSVSVGGANGDWWYLDLAAPSGTALAAGTYTGATRYPFNASSEPGLSLDGNGRGCNTLTGDFTISDITFGPEGYVQQLDATYDQHCEGGTAALHGEVHIANPAPPAALDLGLAVGVNGTASSLDGNATVHGTVSCNKPVTANLTGTVVQVAHRELIRGSYSTSVPCTPGTPAAWTATAVPTGNVPFQKGDVEVQAQASALDADYGQNVMVSQTAVVTLKKS